MPLPNIIVTGTPGTGKTTFSQLLLATLPDGFQHVNIGDVVKREKAHSGWNDESRDATSLNVFIPPRWNLRPKRERA